MQMLYAKAAAHNRKCVFVEFPNGMHMDTWLSGGDRYWKTIQEFLQQHVSERTEDESSNSGKGNMSAQSFALVFTNKYFPPFLKLFSCFQILGLGDLKGLFFEVLCIGSSRTQNNFFYFLLKLQQLKALCED